MHPCGLHFIIGKKGSGKSMLATKLAAKLLAETNRVIITNLPLNLPELRAYILERWPNFKDDMRERVTIITEAKILKRFWLTLGNDWWIPDVPKEQWNTGQRLDYREAYRWLPTTKSTKHRKPIPDLYPNEIEQLCNEEPPQMERKLVSDLRPAQFIIDELQNLFPARGFMQTSHGALFWLSQQRHLAADFIGITQNADLIDKEFRDLADDWLYITNWGRKQKSWFRLPKVMTWAKYDQRPGPGISPMISGTFRMDIQGIGQCYDTSAGVGIEGGLSADTGEKTAGIHWSWFFVAVAIVLIGLFQTPKLLTKGISHLFNHRPALTPAIAQAVTNAPAMTNATSISPPPSGQAPAAPTPLRPNLNVKAPPTTNLTGVTIWNGIATAWLNDGTSVDSTDLRRWRGLIHTGKKIVGVRIDGQTLYLKSTPIERPAAPSYSNPYF